MLEDICFGKELSSDAILSQSSLGLAFLGDGVWSVIVRSYFCENTTFKNNELHKLTTKFVKASFQAKAMDEIEKILDEQLLSVAKRARNAHQATVAKNATLADYKKATSFEAVLGFLYLEHKFDTIQNIFNLLSPYFDEAIKVLKGKLR